MSENRDEMLCLKDFVLLLEGSMKKRTVGEEGKKTVRQCDIGEVKGEGSMESPCVKQPKDVNIGAACCALLRTSLPSLPTFLEKSTMSVKSFV